MNLYYLNPMECCDSDRAWINCIKGNVICPDCKAISLEKRRKGLDVYLSERPVKCAILGAYPSAIGIAQRSFLDLFADVIPGRLQLGAVYGPGGLLLPEYASFVAEKPLLMRGDGRSDYNRCRSCRRFLYSCGGDRRYFLRSSLRDEPLYQCSLSGLVVNEDLRQRVDKKKWKGIYIIKMPIRDEPIDYIDNIPENYYYWGGHE